MQKKLQPEDIHNLQVDKFMHKYTNSKLLATFNNYFELITDVHPCNTTQTKTRQFALPKAHFNLSSKTIKHSTIEILPKIP